MKPRHAPRTAPLIASLVVAIAAVTLILSTVTFLRNYRSSIVESARTSSAQAVSQVVGTVGNYVNTIDEVMNLVMNSMDESPEEQDAFLAALQTTRSEVVAVTTYDADGVLQDCWAKDHTPRQNILRNSSFDLVTAKRRGRGYVSIPHVETIFEGYYPWVVSVVRRMPENSPRQWISMDIRFSALAATINNVGIGQHGYCYLMDERGNTVYHPQQQLLYAGLKKEEAGRLACLGDGTYVEDTVIYTTQKVPGSTWRVVGVSYIDETVNESFWQMTRVVLLASALILVAAFVVAYVLSRSLSRPLQQLENAMEAFEQNADGFVFNAITGTREVEELSDSFRHMVSRIQRLMTAVREEEVALRKTELKALQAQINPHFLYNTLDSIAWMCERGKNADAVQMVHALARLFRISISRGHELIPIEKELQHAEAYLQIQKYRYKNQFTYHFTVDESCTQYLCKTNPATAPASASKTSTTVCASILAPATGFPSTVCPTRVPPSPSACRRSQPTGRAIMIKHVKTLAACLSALLLAGCAASPTHAPTTTRYHVAMIAKSTSTEFWSAVFAGAEAAATEYNMDLTITGSESEEDYSAQNDLIEKAVEEGAQAIIFSASDYQQNAAAIDAAADKGVRIVVVDSAVNSSKVSAYVGADNYGAGQMAAKSALENVEGPLHVGLVNYNVNSPNAQEREKGVIDTLTASGRAEVAATVYSVATPESARAETLTMLARHPEINVLISFNEAVSVGAAQAVSDLGRAEDLWMVAFDSNIKTVDALHTGAVDAMVVQNTYGMGYFSVEIAYKLLAGQGNDVARETQTATRIIDRSNIFALDGQKAVFPFE